MSKDQTNAYVKGFSATTGEPTASFGSLIGEPKPPAKPPWRRHLKDLSRKVAEKLLSRPEAQDFVIEKGKDLIEWVQTILAPLQRRKRQPAEADQV